MNPLLLVHKKPASAGFLLPVINVKVVKTGAIGRKLMKIDLVGCVILCNMSYD